MMTTTMIFFPFLKKMVNVIDVTACDAMWCLEMEWIP
jgi:hypothetical protein